MFVYVPRFMKFVGFIAKLFKIRLSFSGITLGPVAFTNQPVDRLSDRFMNHERIHMHQQLEFFLAAFTASLLVMLVAGHVSVANLILSTVLSVASYFIVYALNWLVNRVRGLSGADAYFKILFEQEAYDNAEDKDYLSYRRPFAWTDYLL